MHPKPQIFLHRNTSNLLQDFVDVCVVLLHTCTGWPYKFEVCSVDEFLNVQNFPSVGAMVFFDR